jgi:molybdenum cofactor cytidylyltransferase
MLNIILLAAGRGLRMGGPNKLLLPFRGSTVLETTLSALCAADIGPVFVVTGHQRELVAPVLAQYRVQEVFNPDFQSGMTSSIQTGVRAEQEAQGYMICLADMPMITAAAYRLLADRFLAHTAQDERAILLPRFGEAKGNPVIFAAAYRDDILRHPEPEGCRGIVQANSAHVHWVDMPDDSILSDLDTQEDYDALFRP